MKKKNFVFFFYLPFVCLILIFSLLSFLNRQTIARQVELLVYQQLKATAEILKKDIVHFLQQGYQIEDILALYSGEENIYFMAILGENKEILDWSSQFEGYLPLSQKDLVPERSWVIPSPLGRVYNYFTAIPQEEGTPVKFLYLGYSLQSLEEMLQQSRKNFFIILALFLGFGLVMSAGFYTLQRRFWEREQEVVQAKSEMEHYREISAFTSGVAHEIKNPLNSLALIFELLGKKAPSSLLPQVRIGQQEVQRISRVVDEFSKVIKPLQIKREKGELREIVDNLLREYEVLAQENKVEVKGEIPPGIRLHVDLLLFSQAVGNIIKNAIEASPGGKVEIAGGKRGKKVLLTVADTGQGLNEAELKQIFEPFFSTKKEGLGIGLYLARKIIEAHGGRIVVQPRPEGGSLFIVEMGGEG